MFSLLQSVITSTQLSWLLFRFPFKWYSLHLIHLWCCGHFRNFRRFQKWKAKWGFLIKRSLEIKVNFVDYLNSIMGKNQWRIKRMSRVKCIFPRSRIGTVSPDLNHIEHAWEQLGRAIRDRNISRSSSLGRVEQNPSWETRTASQQHATPPGGRCFCSWKSYPLLIVVYA